MSRTSSLISLVVNGVGTMLCLSAAITFSVFGNYPAVFWCILACTLAACNTFVRGVHFANKLELWYSLKAIASIRDFGMCVFIIVTGFFLYVLFEIFYFHESIHAPINQSKIIVAVWCFISAKYAFTLFWVGKEYLGFLSETRLILQDDD